MKNKGIIINNGEFKSENTAVGDQASIVNSPSELPNSPSTLKHEANTDDIKLLISKGKLQEAIEILYDIYTDTNNLEGLQIVIINSSKLHQVILDKQMGTISNDEEHLQKANISYSLLQIIDKYL